MLSCAKTKISILRTKHNLFLRRRRILGFVLLLAGLSTSLSAQENRIFGRITDGLDSLVGVRVQISGSPTHAFSDEGGYYEILAQPREVLLFSRAGLDSLKMVVEDVTGRLNVVMRRTVSQLDEVVVTDKKLPRQEQWAIDYETNPSIINTTLGYLNGDASAFHLRVLQGEDLNPAAPDIISAIANRIPGARVGRNRNGERFLLLRGAGSLSNNAAPIYEVDQMIFTSPPDWIPVQNIKRIAIMPGMQAVYRYGAVAGGGVVFINTINGVHGKREPGSNRPYDRARLRDNVASSAFLTPEELLKNAPTYQQALHAAASEAEAREIVDSYTRFYATDPYFFLESYRILSKRWGIGAWDALITSKLSLFEDNPVALKALAYVYEEQGRQEHAHGAYKRVYALRPDYAQSYVDLASSYSGLGDPRRGYSMLARYANLAEQRLSSLDTLYFADMFTSELLATGDLRGNGAADPDGLDHSGIRLVFQWNDGDAEFELQFINPLNRFFTWEHTLDAAEERIFREKIHGYSMQEFFLDESMPGDWEIRCTYRGNRKLSATYLKLYIYRNFGTPAQSREVRTFMLNLKHAPTRLLTLPVVRTYFTPR